MSAPASVLDVLGIGFGPANLALAIALEELAPDLSVRFIERRDGPHWQPGMLLPGSDIQNHPLRDLVTPRNPRSRYSFTNFLFENQRLYEHLNLPLHYPLRLEYAHYVKWVAQFFAHQVDYRREAVAIDAVGDGGAHYLVRTVDGSLYRARSLVFAPGRTPHVPVPFADLEDDRICHLNQYLPSLATTLENHLEARVAVIGGSQSAVEILLHASEQARVAGLVGYTRNFGYRQKDASPFSEEVYFPGFVDAFHGASPENKARLRRELVHTNYSASDADVLNQLYVRRYEDHLRQRQRIDLRTCQEILACHPGPKGVELESRHFLSNEVTRQRFDLVVLATGFLDLGNGDRHEAWPSLLAPLTDGHEELLIARDYRVELGERPPVYFNGLCESSHGMGDAGSFSLLALRSQTIVESLQRQHVETPSYA